SFDSKTYKIADTVTITLNDADLNVDNDLVDIYTAVAPTATGGLINADNQDVATDTIGKAGLGLLSEGNAFGRLVDVQFGQANIRWSDYAINSPTTTNHTATCFGTLTSSTAGGFNTGLAQT